MSPIHTGHTADYLKRQAKKLKKVMGITHTEALDKVVQAIGYSNWKHYTGCTAHVLHQPASKPIPYPSVLPYSLFPNRKVLKRPNAKMPVAAHQEIGTLLQEVHAASYYRKSVNTPVGIVRCDLDDWIQKEYLSHQELPNEVFSKIYYGREGEHPMPERAISEEMKINFINKLRRVQQILGEHYHVCSPLKEMQKRLDSVINALERWPVAMQTISKASRMSAPIKKGTLVWLKPFRRYARVYRHEVWGSVHCYSEAGFGTLSRQEVSVPVDQSSTASLLPMRLYLPYGKWICADGTEVLYNRDYCPIWAKTPAGEVLTLDPDTWISGIQNSNHSYFGDGSKPWNDKATLEKCLNALKEWGVQKRRPRILDVFDAVLETGGDFDLLQKKSMDKRFPV